MKRFHVLTLALATLAAASSATANSLYVTLQSPPSIVAVDETTGLSSNIITSGLVFPRGIVFSPANGHVYVADAPSPANNYNSHDQLTIKEFTTGGVFVGSFGGGSGGIFGGGLAVDTSGNLYVAAAFEDQFGGYGGGQVREYAATGVLLATAPAPTGSFIPFGVAVTPSNELIVTDLNGRVLKFGAGLSSVSTIGDPLPLSPYGIAVAGNGNIYVGIPTSGTNVYDSSGALLDQATPLGGFANVLGADGFLYALNPPNVYQLDVPTATPVSFSAINNQLLSGAEWMTEVQAPEPSSLALLGIGIVMLGLIRRSQAQRNRVS